METKELRLGNLIYWDIPQKLGVVHEVSRIMFNRVNTIPISLGNDMIEYSPIPLTEEWLIKFGFDCAIKKGNQNDFRVCINKSLTYNSNHGWWYNGMKLDLQPEYVHTLQNLYFTLTGEELILKIDNI